MHLFSSLLAGFANLFANASATGSWWFWYEEPECPKSLIK